MVAGGRRRGMHSIRLMALDPDDKRKMIGTSIGAS